MAIGGPAATDKPNIAGRLRSSSIATQPTHSFAGSGRKYTARRWRLRSTATGIPIGGSEVPSGWSFSDFLTCRDPIPAPNQSIVSTVVKYCTIARVSRPPAPAAPTPAAPATHGHRQRKQTDDSRGAGSRGGLTGDRQAEVRIHLRLRRILCRSHTTVLRKLVELVADSLDYRLVILVAQFACALLVAGGAQRLLESLDGVQVGSPASPPFGSRGMSSRPIS